MTDKEIQNLRSVDRHPNVVRIYDADVFWEGEMEYIYIAMELCSHKTLHDYVTNKAQLYDIEVAVSHCTQLLSGLKYVHEQGICHHDLKPHNILFALKNDESVSYDEVKMIDFGFSKRFQIDSSASKSTAQPAGTQGYMAPEVLDLRHKIELGNVDDIEEAKKKISEKIDVFSMALVLCFCLSGGYHPYGKISLKQDVNILEGEEPDLSKIHDRIGQKTKGLLRQMLSHEPDDRPSMKEVWKTWRKIIRKPEEFGEVEEVCLRELKAKPNTEEPEVIIPGPSMAIFETGASEFGSVYSVQLGNNAVKVKQVAHVPTTIINGQTYTAVVMKRKLYVLTWMKIVSVLDMGYLDLGWRRLPSMGRLHGIYPPAVVVEDKIYVCGGGWDFPGVFRKEGVRFPLASRSCEIYDTRRGVWIEIDSLEHKRGHNTVAALGEHVYSIGGWNLDEEPLKSVEKFIPKLNKWQPVASLNEARYNATASTLKNKIYVLGGEKRPTIESYDPTDDTWTLLLSLELPLSVDETSLSAVPLSDKLYIIGGGAGYWMDLEENEFKKEHVIKLSINEKTAVALN